MVERAPSAWSHGERNHVATKVEAGLRAGALLLGGMEGLASGEIVVYERFYRK